MELFPITTIINKPGLIKSKHEGQVGDPLPAPPRSRTPRPLLVAHRAQAFAIRCIMPRGQPGRYCALV